MHQSLKAWKYGKKSKSRHSEENDRISSFPDGILSHILSFMPTKYAVRTSLLSTRWKSLWTLVPSFDLENYTRGHDKDESSGFMDFVDRVLLLHNLPNVNKFHLNCEDGYYNPYRLNSWISTAIKLNVQELVLTLNIEPVVELPRSLFSSVNLVVLKLDGEVLFRFPMPVLLPSLKVLHLSMLTFLDDNSFKNLLSGCPVLEELDIYVSAADNTETLCICSSTLKKLCVDNSCKDGSFRYGLVIKAPALEILELSDYVSHVFDVDELSSIGKATICVAFPDDGFCRRTDDYYDNVVGMLGKISNAHHLKLSNDTFKVAMQASAYNLLFFHNLTHLDIEIDDIQWSLLSDLLGRMPNVKVLVFQKDRKWCESCLWRAAPDIVPRCLLLCLETIEFSGFAGCTEEMKLVRYLLENAMVLKKLTLTSITRDKNTRTRILQFPRGSSSCQIELWYQKPGTFASSLQWCSGFDGQDQQLLF